MCWSTWVPSLETSHLRVSQIRWTASATSAPFSTSVRVTPSRWSPFSARLTLHGSSLHSDSHEPVMGASGASLMSGPATRAEARATAAACSPARRAAALPTSGTEKKPQLEPISARTPTPARSSRSRVSTAPLRAAIASVRVSMTRASAYEAPAARAASTAAVAMSSIDQRVRPPAAVAHYNAGLGTRALGRARGVSPVAHRTALAAAPRDPQQDHGPHPVRPPGLAQPGDVGRACLGDPVQVANDVQPDLVGVGDPVGHAAAPVVDALGGERPDARELQEAGQRLVRRQR